MFGCITKYAGVCGIDVLTGFILVTTSTTVWSWAFYLSLIHIYICTHINIYKNWTFLIFYSSTNAKIYHFPRATQANWFFLFTPHKCIFTYCIYTLLCKYIHIIYIRIFMISMHFLIEIHQKANTLNVLSQEANMIN